MAALTVTAASVVPSANTVYGDALVAGETITAGMPVYLKTSDGKLWKSLAVGTPAVAAAVGIAMHAALANQPLVYAKGGTINIGATTAKTTTYFVGAAAGEVVPQADLASTNNITRLGYATATDGTFVIDIKATGAVV